MDYLSIKSLSSMYTDNTLLEGVDYDIENFSTIKFKKRFGNSNSDKLIMLPSFDESDYPTDIYTSISGVVLNPVIKELYKPALGSSNPTKDLLTRFYTPFTKEHREESNEHEKTKI
ncbi:hypothetical protein H8D85_02140 [bacterium]|nr:hypothetical protein [bacterium]